MEILASNFDFLVAVKVEGDGEVSGRTVIAAVASGGRTMVHQTQGRCYKGAEVQGCAL